MKNQKIRSKSEKCGIEPTEFKNVLEVHLPWSPCQSLREITPKLVQVHGETDVFCMSRASRLDSADLRLRQGVDIVHHDTQTNKQIIDFWYLNIDILLEVQNIKFN